MVEPPAEEPLDDLDEEEAPPQRSAQPRFCLRCTDTEMQYFCNLKLQLEGYYGPGSLLNLFEDENDPESLSLLPLEMYVCPKCRRTELVWSLAVLPDGGELPESGVLKHERTFRKCTMQQLRQIIEGKEYDEEMKQAAQNILSRRLSGE